MSKREHRDVEEGLRERGIALIARMTAMADRLAADAAELREQTTELRAVVADLRDPRVPAQDDGGEVPGGR